MDKEELYRAWDELGPEMNPGERMMKYFSGEEVDCIPYGLLAAEDALCGVFGSTKKQVADDYELRCEVCRRGAEITGSLAVGLGMGLRGIGEAAGSQLAYPENAVDFVAHHTCQDYDEFFSRPAFDVYTNPVLAPKLEEVKRLVEDFPGVPFSTGVAGPISTAAAIRPVEKILRDTRRNPEQLHKLLDFSVDASLQWIKAVHEITGGKMSAAIADPVTTTDIISHKQFLEFNKPYLKRLFDEMTRIVGKAPTVHICGHTKGIWEDLMDIGVTSFSLDNCESLAEARQVMGDKVLISGNVPPVDVMLLGSIDDVIASVRECIIAGAGNPRGFLLMTGCQVPMGTPKENMIAFRYAARKYGAKAKLGQIPEAVYRD